MSVKKYIVNKKIGNFTTIPNKVLQNLKDFEALGLYCYLVSLPHNWEFYKEKLREHGNIGIHKFNSLLKILEKHCLVKTEQIRDKQGRFSHFNLHVDDGNDFKIIELEKDESPCYKNRNTETVRTVNNTYKRNIEKSNKTKQTKSFCLKPKSERKKENERRHEWAPEKNEHLEKTLREHEKRKEEEMRMRRVGRQELNKIMPTLRV